MKNIKRIAYFTLSLSYFAAALGCSAYAALTETGPYRVMTQWQLGVFEIYSGPLTFAVLFAALTALGILWVAVLARWLMPQTRDAAVAARSWGPAARRTSGPATAVFGRIAAMPLVAAAIGFALLVGGIAAGYRLAATARQEVSVQEIDAAKPEPPTAGYVRITGVAHTDLVFRVETRSRWRTTIQSYVPITARDWRRDQPVGYFLKVTEQEETLPIISRRAPALSPDARPALVTLRAAAGGAGLPASAARGFGNAHLTLAESPAVLDLELHPNVKTAQQVAYLAAVVGMFLFVFGLLFRAAGRHLPGPVQAAPDVAR